MSDSFDPNRPDPNNPYGQGPQPGGWQDGPTQQGPSPYPQQPGQSYGAQAPGQPYGQQQQWGQQPYGQQQWGQQQPYGQFPGGQPPYGQYPGGQPPKSGGSAKIVVIVGVCLVVLIAVVGGLAWFVTRDGNDHQTAGASSSSPTSTGATDSVITDPADPTNPNIPNYPGTTTPSPVSYYGAIAYSQVTGNVGYAINSLTQQAAVDAAMGKCAVSSCETVVRFENACGAIAQSQVNRAWGWGWSATRQGAVDEAISQVDGAQPKLLTVQCTNNAQG